MKRNIFLYTVIFCCLLLMTACNAGKKEEENDAEVLSEEQAGNEQGEGVAAEEEQEEEEEEEEVEPQEDPEKKDDKQETVQLGDYNIFIGGEMIETEDKILVYGESNLLPGARVVGEVMAGDEEFFADTTEIVEEDGTFYMEIPYNPINKEAIVAVKFDFDGPQDDGIIRHYGDRGQKLEGPYIYKHQRKAGGRSPKDIFKKAEVRTSFEPTKEMAVRQFKEPTWYDIPEDMGSPRVWIEVEEINNDEDHFYLHGRSNLVEGSKIRVKYKYYNQDETIVNPDGSFDFKLDYEYAEDTPFEIEFIPHGFQWNNVEEVYGKEGQNLVGDLVEANKYNNKQIIKKIVELESTEIDVPDHVELNIQGSEVTMLVPDDVLFDFDKYALKDSSKAVLKDIAKVLETSFNKKDFEIVINGHTDNAGNKEYNLELSEKRAEEVKDYLASELKGQDITFKTKGYGDSKPIASNDNESGQAKNRRVEIVINLR